MSTTDRYRTIVAPPLVAGDRLSRAEFHRRYEASPEDLRAELIDGEVFMASPVRSDHAFTSRRISTILGLYQSYTPGVGGGDNLTLIVDDSTELQPDCVLLINPDHGGRTKLENGFIIGGPELVVEISGSSKRIDLGKKYREYESAGVLEYLVIAIDPDEVHRFVLGKNGFESRRLEADSILKSFAFPGLWIDCEGLFQDNLARMIEILQTGIASPEHAAFVSRLAATRRDDSVD
jgi:Uma2 family endonuclease